MALLLFDRVFPSFFLQQVDMNDLIHRQQVHVRIRRHARMDMHGRMDVRHIPVPVPILNRDREPVKREVRHARVNIEGDIIRYEHCFRNLPYPSEVTFSEVTFKLSESKRESEYFLSFLQSFSVIEKSVMAIVVIRFCRSYIM